MFPNVLNCVADVSLNTRGEVFRGRAQTLRGPCGSPQLSACFVLMLG